MASMASTSTWAIRKRIAALLRASEITPPPPSTELGNTAALPFLPPPPKLPPLKLNSIYTVCGWSRTLRKQGGGRFCFLSLNDGSTTSNLQVVVHDTLPNFEDILKNGGVGAALRVVGMLVASPAAGQPVEMVCDDPSLHFIEVYGSSDTTVYPLAKKKHSKEYLRSIAHLRPRTNIFGATTRIRANLAMAIHQFFYEQGFFHIHTPIISCSDCEGAGELFQVTTLLPPSDTRGASIDYKKDFFNRPAYLAVSGQLQAESFCSGMGDVYTFGPAFRAENSHTSRHLAEFWMIEPEMAFADIQDCMSIAESLVLYCISWCLTHCLSDLEWLDAHEKQGLVASLRSIMASSIPRITYTEAIEMLRSHEKAYHSSLEWGMDLQTEHERYLCETIFKSPVSVYNYPRGIKSFYMRLNDDGETVAGMDLLLPGIGELVGGSQREERLDYLDAAMERKQLNSKDYGWYRELRQYGTVPHAGFGLGFERLVMLITGIENIRDVIPFPRYPGHAGF